MVPVVHPILRSLATDGPMLPTLVDGLPERAGWVLEPKWDGWRSLAVIGDGRLDLRSRRATDLAPYFPELTRPPTALAGHQAVLDGEVVLLRNGRPDFDAISGWMAARRLADWAARTSPATFIAFDILELDGRSLAEQPYSHRREALEALGFDALRWALTPSYGEGEAIWAATRDLGLEGIVAKDPRSPWVARRSRRWLKCKHWRHGTFAVMGWAPPTAREPAGLVVGAAGAIGERRVAGVATLHADHSSGPSWACSRSCDPTGHR